MRGVFAGVCLVTFVAGLAGQDATRIRVVDRKDGTPRPGVVVHAAPRDARSSQLDPTGDWVTNTDDRVRALRAAVSARTDPEGWAELVLPRKALAENDVFVGAPFVGSLFAPVPVAVLVLEADQHEPFSVRVVDASGVPLADFAVALHAAGEDVTVAVTDARGIAALGVPPGFAARLSVAPAGWIGPRDGFPTVATMLQRKQETLVVPQSGWLRLRAVRGGEAVRVTVGAASILQDGRWASAHPGPEDGPVSGFQFGPVALGQRLHCTAWIGGRNFRVDVDGPRAGGGIAVFDADVDPARPRIAFTLTGEAARLLGGRRPRVQVESTARASVAYAQPDGAGGFVADFENLLDLGEQVVRVAIDESTAAHEDTPAKVWSASVPVGRAFGAAPLQLGAIELVGFPPLVRGRVVDRDGRPVARAQVLLRPDPASAVKLRSVTTVFTGTDGSFEHRGPVPRDQDGNPAPVVAVARFAGAESPATGPLSIGQEVVLTMPGPVVEAPGNPRGELAAHLVGLPSAVVDQVRVEVVDADGRTFAATGGVAVAHAGGVARFVGLPAGRYALRVSTPWAGGAPLLIEGLEVPLDGACTDERLARLEIGAALQVIALRVVDPEGVPIAGARVEMRSGQDVLQRETDGAGRVFVAHARGVAPRVTVSANGMRPQELDDPSGDVVVTMEPAGEVTVRVRGIPADLARDRIRVWLMPDERAGFARAERAALGAADAATLPLPARGRYVVALYVVLEERPDGMKARRVALGAPFEIGDEPPERIELRLDDAAVEQLREVLSR